MLLVWHRLKLGTKHIGLWFLQLLTSLEEINQYDNKQLQWCYNLEIHIGLSKVYIVAYFVATVAKHWDRLGAKKKKIERIILTNA